ncbi:MAG: septal ring lytic transglycosylase RlpA family protein [Patescibacteria group bacterium]
MKKIISLFSISIFALFLIFSNPCLAENKVRVGLDKSTLEKGYTISYDNDNLKIGIQPNTFKKKTAIKIYTKKKISTKNKNKKEISSIYKIKEVKKRKQHRPLNIAIKYFDNAVDSSDKNIYYYKKKDAKWKKVRTNIVEDQNLAVINLRRKRINQLAVFESTEFQTGGATWYNWYGAASNDYPMGTTLKVTNLENGKTTTVEIVSTGPFTPGLIIDLPKEKFAELASPSVGIIQVRVEEI